MNRSDQSVMWNLQKFHNQGRPLTKTSLHLGYPNQTSGGLANASFLPHDKQALLNALTADEEWVALEREIFNTCLEPQKQNPTFSIERKSEDSRILRPKCHNHEDQQTRKFCQFCAKNGEVKSVVESHNLRHPVSRVILCPVLRRYKCELCGATGDDAHTKFYCPLNANRSSAPAAVLLKSTKNNATGRRT